MAHGKRHPRDMGVVEVEAFLTGLATHGNVAVGTQNQALSALLFLHREVLSVELPWMQTIVRAKRPQRVPVVLSRDPRGGEWRRHDLGEAGLQQAVRAARMSPPRRSKRMCSTVAGRG